MNPSKKPPTPSSKKKNISISGDVTNSNVVNGDNNVFQKIVNYIFPSGKETLEQRSRRALLKNVENFWIKGVLEKSLHGSALLELGIKEDPKAINTYPWGIKKEETNEAIPAGTSMLEIFDSIGMGRSLLILGAPGSGKTTMLLELTRLLIERAQKDVTEPIPMVFNLASWTEKLTLADWLSRELNNFYFVSNKDANIFLSEHKLFLLLDGLDEVKQGNRAKCVNAIDVFRKEYGLTSLALCSRSHEYAELNIKVPFNGAIEIQSLTHDQVDIYLESFGSQLSTIRLILLEDTALREMAATPLFLSTMVLAYQNMRRKDISTSKNLLLQKKYLFETYTKRMLERPRTQNSVFSKQSTLNWISWIANKMIANGFTTYHLENIQPAWLETSHRKLYKVFILFIFGVAGALLLSFLSALLSGLVGSLLFGIDSNIVSGLMVSVVVGGISIGFIVGVLYGLTIRIEDRSISTVDSFFVDWGVVKKQLMYGGIIGLLLGVIPGMLGIKANSIFDFEIISGVVIGGSDYYANFGGNFNKAMEGGLFWGLPLGLLFSLVSGFISGLRIKKIDQIEYSGQRLFFTIKNSLLALIYFGIMGGLIGELIAGQVGGVILGLLLGLLSNLYYGGYDITLHYFLRFILARNNLLPWKLVSFLDHCVDLIFLRRVGGGYIFIHRLLMEHFAEKYKEEK